MGMTWSSEVVERIRAQLRRAEPPFVSLAADGWLLDSCRDPAPFLLALGRCVGERIAPLKSHPAQGFDLAHDLLLRHSWKEREILASYDRRSGFCRLNVESLIAGSARLATAWSRRGLAAGDRIALLLPLGPELLVALLAALRLGLVITPIPPRGSLLTQKRIEKLAPDYVHTISLYSPLLRTLALKPEQLLIDAPPPSAPGERYASHTYQPEAAVFALFSPLTEPCEVREVQAEQLWAGCLRDLLVCLSLDPGQVLAAPGALHEQYVPGLLLASLLGGVTYVHLPIEDLQKDPRLLSAYPINLLLVGRELRDLLIGAPRGLLPRLEALLRDPLESTDLGPWQRLRTSQGWESLPIGNLIFDSAAGGSLLFSLRQRRVIANQLLPAPGRSYVLLSPDDAAQPAPGEFGAFSLSAEEPGFIVLGRSEDQYQFGGTLTPRREGRRYPEACALDALIGLPFVDGAAVAEVPSGDGTGRTLVVLVVLTGAEPASQAERERGDRSEQINRRLKAQLGEPYLPDQIIQYPLIARRTGGAVDIERVRTEYLSGATHRKSRERLFSTLHALRAACNESALDRQRRALLSASSTEAAC